MMDNFFELVTVDMIVFYFEGKGICRIEPELDIVGGLST